MNIIYDRADSADMFYLCGFDSDTECLYVDGTLYVPGFEYLRAKKKVTAVRVEKLTSENVDEILGACTGKVTVNRTFPHHLALKISGEISVGEVTQRQIKTSEEIKRLRDIQELTRDTITLIIQKIESCTVHDGVLRDESGVVTSEDLKLLARTALIRNGADCPDLIVASGSQTGQPHNRGTGPIRAGPVIIDVFPRDEKTKYFGDMTRTVIVGEDEKSAKMLAAVKAVHAMCIEKAQPGVKVATLHQLALDELEKRGFATGDETGLIHSLGHGIGLAVHEKPTLHMKSDAVLEEGMVVTIEPGLYYETGVRWEDMIVVGGDVL